MKFLIGIILLTFAAIATAQPSLMIGGGGNYTIITDNDTGVESSLPRPGMNFKLGFENRFSPYFSFITGLALESRGEIDKNTNAAMLTIEENYKAFMVQLPLAAQLNIPVGNILCLNVFGGPEFGIALSAEKKSYMNNDPDPIDTVDFSEELRMFDFGFNVGIGIEINTGKFGAIFIRPGVYFGLLDYLDEKTAKKNGIDPTGKHQSLYVTLGYKINKRPKSPVMDEMISRTDEKDTSEQNTSTAEQYNSYRSQDSENSTTSSDYSGENDSSSDYGSSPDEY